MKRISSFNFCGVGIAAITLVIFTGCSSAYENITLTTAKPSSACFGSSCGACTRVVATISTPPQVQNSSEHQSIDYYRNADGTLKYLQNIYYGGFYYAFFPLVLNNDFGLVGGSGNLLSRNGERINNYFLMRSITSLTLPQDENPKGDFFRESIAGKTFRITVASESSIEAKIINSDGSRTVVVSKPEPQTPGATLSCIPGTFVLNGTDSIDLELDWAIASGEVNAPPQNTSYSLGFTENTSQQALDMCGQKVWATTDTRRPESGPSRGITTDDLLMTGQLGIPKELYQTAAESRAENPDLKICSIEE